MNEEAQQALDEWLADRPQIIKDLAQACPPDGLYKLVDYTSDAEDVYTIISYSEDGTIRATRYSVFEDAMVPMWNVFGMKPECLVRVDEPFPNSHSSVATEAS